MKIILFLGMIILAVVTVGYGASLNSSPTIDKIGSEDNASVDRPSVNITNMVLRQSGANVNRITVTVENQDSVAHTYKICAIVTAGAQMSDDSGTGADCVNTASCNPASTRSAAINLTHTVTTNNLSYWNISVEEIV